MLVRASFMLLAVTALSGCGGLRLYSEARDKQGEAAVKAWSEVDLRAAFQTERDNAAKVLEQETATSRRFIEAQRDNEIRILVRLPVNRIPERFDKALVPLVGSKPADAEAAMTAIDEALRILAGLREQLQSRYAFLDQLGAPHPTCEAARTAGTPDQAPSITQWAKDHPADARKYLTLVNGVSEACVEIAKEEQAIQPPGDGAIKDLYAQRAKAAAQLASQRSAALAAAADYREAARQYQAELDAQKPGTPAGDKLAHAAAKLQTALAAFDKLPTPWKDELIAQERIATLNEFLSALKAGGEPQPDDTKAEVAARLLPKLADDLRAVRTAGHGRHVVPLLIQRDVEQARLNAAKLETTMADTEIALLDEEIRSRLAEAKLLYQARRLFAGTDAARSTTLHGLDGKTLSLDAIDTSQGGKVNLANEARPFHAAWGSLTPANKMALLESTGTYLDATGRQRTESERLRATRRALPYQKASGLSEINAALWTALIGATVNQAAEFAKTGIKASDLDALIMAVPLLWIGHGVN